jgi:hypothetical protein
MAPAWRNDGAGTRDKFLVYGRTGYGALLPHRVPAVKKSSCDATLRLPRAIAATRSRYGSAWIISPSN